MNKLIPSLILSFCIHFAYGQDKADYSIYYDFQYTWDTSNIELSHAYPFFLYRVKDKSYFLSEGRYYNDSISYAFAKENKPAKFNSQSELQAYMDKRNQELVKKAPGIPYVTVKDFRKHVVQNFLYYKVPSQYMEEPLNLNWQITNRQENILGLSCLEAITQYGGRTYHAWFTTEIPINDGPYIFSGLPGLILKLKDDRGWYQFVATQVSTQKNNCFVNQNRITKYSKKIARDVFVQKAIDLKNDPKLPAGVLNFSEADRLELRQKYVRRYDLIIEQKDQKD